MRPGSRLSGMAETKMNNSAPLFASHLRKHALVQKHGSQQVPLHQHLNLGLGIVCKQSAFANERSCIIHQYINTAQLDFNLFYQHGDVFRFGNVCLNGNALYTFCSDLGLKCFSFDTAVHIIQGNMASLICQTKGRHFSKTFGTSRYEGNLPLHVHPPLQRAVIH
ncbi:hypothetical protein D3C76_1403150 [compost metagenome]